LKIPQ